MVDCGPACAIPSCASETTVGLGSADHRGYGNLGTLGNLGGFSYDGFGYGGGALAESASNLGILNGIILSCINQVSPGEVLNQPAPVVVTIPGAILSATCEPVAVGVYAPCAVSGIGLAGGLGHYDFGSGFGNRRFGGQRGYPRQNNRHCASICN